MPVKNSTSIEIQLEREIEKLSKRDQARCRTLLLAIRCLQKPQFFGRLPKHLVGALEKWERKVGNQWRTKPELVQRLVQLAERSKLPRSRAEHSGRETAFSRVALQLGLSEGTVIKIAGRRVTSGDAEKELK